MVLTRTEKVNLVKSLSAKQREEIKVALMGMGGNGIREIAQKVSATLKPIIKVVGPVLLREILLPALKKKILGEGKKVAQTHKGKGLKTAGGALLLAGQRRRNTM